MTVGLFRSKLRGLPEEQDVRKISIPIDTELFLVGNFFDGFGSATIADFPTGNILVLGGLFKFSLDKQGFGFIIDTFTAAVAVGTDFGGATFISGSTNFFINRNAAIAVGGVSSGNVFDVGAAVRGTVAQSTTRIMRISIVVPDAEVSNSGNVRIRGELHLVYSVLGEI